MANDAPDDSETIHFHEVCDNGNTARIRLHDGLTLQTIQTMRFWTLNGKNIMYKRKNYKWSQKSLHIERLERQWREFKMKKSDIVRIYADFNNQQPVCKLKRFKKSSGNIVKGRIGSSEARQRLVRGL